jgi:hypothetical protein
MLPTRYARGTNVRGTPRESYSSQQAVHAPPRCCSTHSTATAARASRRSPWSASMFILAGRPLCERLSVRHPPIHRNPRTNTMRDKLPMHLSPRCGARTRSQTPCQAPAMPNGRCRMHGGMSPGAPKGNKNALKHGRYTAEAIARRREIQPCCAR